MQQSKKVMITSLLIAGSLAAEAQSDKDSVKTRELELVQVNAVRAGSDAPFAKTTISSMDIKKANSGQDLPYILQYTPSTVVSSDAGAGIGYTSMRIRGTDATRINVTFNGVPVNDPESAGTFFVNFADIMSSTSSVQIQRGVGTSTNGSGAFGATMSISNLSRMEEAGVELQAGLGSFNSKRLTLKAGTGMLKNGLQLDVRLSKILSDGYIQRSASDLKSMQVNAGWKAGDRTQFRFMFMSGQERTGQAWDGVPQDSLATNPRFNGLGLKSDGSYYQNQTDNYRQDYYQLFMDRQLSKYWFLNTGLYLTRGIGYYEEYRADEKFSSYYLPNFTTSNDTLKRTDLIRRLYLDNYYYGVLANAFYKKRNSELTIGTALTRYDARHYGDVIWAQYGIADNYRWYDLTAQKSDYSLFAKLQQKLTEKGIVFADLQYRHVQYDVQGFRKNPDLSPSATYNFINPKLGYTYLLRKEKDNQQKAYASVAVANKEPNRNDFEASPADLPKSETLYDVEAGYEIAQSKWAFSANFYYMYYHNQLVLTGQINDVGAYTRSNVDRSFRTGIELQGGYKALSWLDINANATFSVNKIQNSLEFIDDWDNGSQVQVAHGTKDIAFSPNAIAAAIATFKPFKNLESIHHQKFEIDLAGKYVGRQYLDNTQNKGRSIAAYGLCDIRVRYSVPVKPFKEAAIALFLNNVLDKKYENNGYTYSYLYNGDMYTSNNYFPQAGFNWMLGVTLKW